MVLQLRGGLIIAWLCGSTHVAFHSCLMLSGRGRDVQCRAFWYGASCGPWTGRPSCDWKLVYDLVVVG